MMEDITTHIRKCETCLETTQTTKANGLQVVGHKTFSRLQIDHKMLPETIRLRTTFTAILTMIDTCSGMVVYAPVQTLTAGETALHIFNSWIRIFGIPATIQCDNSTSFTDAKGNPNDVTQELGRLFGITLAIITPYHPPANGRVGRKNKDVGKWLESFADHVTDEKTLKIYLSLAEMSSNHYSDSYVIAFGEEARTLSKALSEMTPPAQGTIDDIEFMDENFISRLREITSENTEWHKAMMEDNARYNSLLLDARQSRKRTTKASFALGEEVWYDNKIWTLSSLRYAHDKETPTSAVLISVEDPNIHTRARFELLRPKPEPIAVPGEIYPTPLPESDDFVFYKVGTDVFSGKVEGTIENRVIVHVYSKHAHSYRIGGARHLKQTGA